MKKFAAWVSETRLLNADGSPNEELAENLRQAEELANLPNITSAMAGHAHSLSHSGNAILLTCDLDDILFKRHYVLQNDINESRSPHFPAWVALDIKEEKKGLRVVTAAGSFVLFRPYLEKQSG